MSEQNYNASGAALVSATLAAFQERGIDPADPGDRPAIFRHGSARFEISADGVRFVSGEGTSKRLCDELRIEAKTRDARSGNWGLLLRWKDADGSPHTWIMPMEMLHGDGTEVTRALATNGLQIMPGASSRLREYLTVCETPARARCVEQLGWHGSSYCTPDETIGGAAGDRIVFEGTASANAEHGRAGTPGDWRSGVAALAAGNTRLVFAISCAFAGPLLHLARVESGGFHFIGPSSSGKTTALRVAASVWGHPDTFTRQWRATANGLEGLAALHNDGLLILDELSQCEPKQAGEAAYMLANGKGKARASRTGGARESATWRLLFLSSGEVPLSTHLESIGKRANAGQELRLADIPADAGKGLGMFNVVHGRQTPSAFANDLKGACVNYHGAVGREFLRLVVQDSHQLADEIAEGVRDFIGTIVPAGASGQVDRVASRFGLIAAAGELATNYELTGWAEGEAARAAGECFNAWLEGFGVGNREEKAIVEQVRGFIEKHGASRFQNIDAEGAQIFNRSGFWREKDGVRQYLVPSATFKAELVAGSDPVRAAKVLAAHKMLLPGQDRQQQKVRLGEMGPTWVYVITIPEEAQS